MKSGALLGQVLVNETLLASDVHNSSGPWPGTTGTCAPWQAWLPTHTGTQVDRWLHLVRIPGS